ncbi:MAG: hormogonium polysaccharide biosynthesis glycosyltransferase HpsE [Cyanobacteria bacterium P01_A01_bin.116]
MDLTVVICTYNGADRLPAVLDRLADQVIAPCVSWELVVVDNNSQDRSAQVASGHPVKVLLSSRMKIVYEHRQGLAYARRRAVQIANGALIAFLDDDNLPSQNWIQSVYNFGQQYPDAGAYGSQIIGQYGAPPPPKFERIACFLAVIDRGNQPFRYDQLDRWLFPAGAGLVVRKQAWLQAVPEQPALSGVSAKGLNGKGEDIETLSYLRKAGWPIWHNPDMRIEHVIERDRLSENYLLKLFKGVGLSRYHTRTIRFSAWQKLPVTTAYILKDLSRLVVHRLEHYKSRREGRNSIVVSCERTLLYYSILSPFYHFFNSISKPQILKIMLKSIRSIERHVLIRFKSFRVDSS